MHKLTFPEKQLRSHSPIHNVNELFDEQISPGQRATDWIAKTHRI